MVGQGVGLDARSTGYRFEALVVDNLSLVTSIAMVYKSQLVVGCIDSSLFKGKPLQY